MNQLLWYKKSKVKKQNIPTIFLRNLLSTHRKKWKNDTEFASLPPILCWHPKVVVQLFKQTLSKGIHETHKVISLNTWVRHGWDMSTLHATLTPWRGLGDKYKAQLAEPSTEPFLKQQQFAQKTGDCETNLKKCLGNTSRNLLGGENHLLQRTLEDKRAILP